MPTMTVLVDGAIPVAEDFNGNFRRLNQALGVNTAITAYLTGDLVYASGADTLARRAIGAEGAVLSVVSGLPAWSTAAGSVGTWAQRGLQGIVSTTTIAVSAHAVALRNSNKALVVHENVGTVTLDSGAVGLNGRDQTVAFSAGQDLYAYWISNGTTLRTVLADSVPPTGPDLTTLAAFSGYTYWGPIGPVRWNGLSNFIPLRIRGAQFFYEAQQAVISDGLATVETAVSVSAFVPAAATTWDLGIWAYNQTNSSYVTIRVVTGADYDTKPAGVLAMVDLARCTLTLPNISQQFFYLLAAANGAGAGLFGSVRGYRVANGDS